MNRINLSKTQLELFLKLMKNQKIIFKVDNNIILIDNINKDKVVDFLSNYFVKNCLNKEFEPNQLGVNIENLLDKFTL